MIVLGLDPSLTAYGWALHDTCATGASRCVARGRYSSPASEVFVDRYVFARESLRALLKSHKPDRVGIESPPFGESFSEGMYGLFLYSNEALKSEGMDVVYLSAGQVKAHARESLGRPDKWKMMKPDMVAAAKADTASNSTAKRGVGSWDHNEADAYLVGRLAGRFWEYHVGNVPKAALTPVETRQFAYTHTFSRGKKAGKTVRSGLQFREQDRFFCWSQLATMI